MEDRMKEIGLWWSLCVWSSVTFEEQIELLFQTISRGRFWICKLWVSMCQNVSGALSQLVITAALLSRVVLPPTSKKQSPAVQPYILEHIPALAKRSWLQCSWARNHFSIWRPLCHWLSLCENEKTLCATMGWMTAKLRICRHACHCLQEPNQVFRLGKGLFCMELLDLEQNLST